MEVMELSEPKCCPDCPPVRKLAKTASMGMNSGYGTFIVGYARLTSKGRLVLDSNRAALNSPCACWEESQ